MYERCIGFTFACGSGAIATFAAANKLGLVNDQAEVVFQFGSLHIKKESSFSKGGFRFIMTTYSMSGPATYVFTG